jgi:hypothetical protein
MGLLSRLFFPLLLMLWFLLFAFARNPEKKAEVAEEKSGNLRSKEAPPLSRQEKEEASLGGGDLTNKKGASKTVAAKSKGDKSAPTASKMFPPSVRETQMTHAVIVAGHAVLRINKLTSAEREDGAWYLLSYQLNQGFPGIITSHIKKGIQLTMDDPAAMLLFSGGQTRRDVGPTSEAASYYYLAAEKKWLTAKGGSSIANRVFLEEHARDSYENLLFSLCRFREVTGRYPQKVTVIGFDFKGKRFTDFHRLAIGFPRSNFSYVGIRPQHPNFDHKKAAKGEEETIRVFKNDLYGCSAALSGKRDIRNPFLRTVPYELACPELRKLLFWCGPGQISPDSIPWASAQP